MPSLRVMVIVRLYSSNVHSPKGLPEDFLAEHYDQCVRIPMREGIRSLNLSNAVAITVFEALRQLSFPALQEFGNMRK